MSYLFLIFCGEIIRVLYAIFAIIIENLEVYYINVNLLLGKSTI